MSHFQLTRPGMRMAGAGSTSAIAKPTQQVTSIENSDDVLRAALRVIDGNAGVGFLGDALEGFVERHIAGKREDVRPWNHDLADDDVLQFERALDHLLLRRFQNSGAMTGGHNQLELFGGVYAALTYLLGAESPQNDPGGGSHDGQQRSGQGHEKIDRPGHSEGHGLGALQRQRFG